MFLPLLEDAVKNDNTEDVLELLKDKIKYNYTWTNDLSSTTVDNCIKRTKLECWYCLFWWIVNYKSIHVCDQIVQLHWYSPGHLYNEMLRVALERADLHLVKNLMTKSKSKETVLSNFLYKNTVISKKQWKAISILLKDPKILSQEVLIKVCEHKGFQFVSKYLQKSNFSLTQPDIILTLIDQKHNKNITNFLNFILEQPSSYLSQNIRNYINHTNDSKSFLHKLISENYIQFIQYLHLQDHVYTINELFEDIHEIINHNQLNILKYILNNITYCEFYDDNVFNKISKMITTYKQIT